MSLDSSQFRKLLQSVLTVSERERVTTRSKIRCRIKVGAIDAAALGRFENSHGRVKGKRLLCFGCDFSGCTLSEKSLKVLPTDVIF